MGTKAIDIKTCPFCGQYPSLTIERTEISEAIGKDEFRGRADCCNRSCSVKPFLGPVVFMDKTISSSEEKTREALVKSWNKRAPCCR